MITITGPQYGEEAELAKLWHESWHFAHAHLVDPVLRDVRSLESFKTRVSELLSQTLVARLDGQPIGISIIKDRELYQFFMSAEGRGTGAAVQLMQKTEQKLAVESPGEVYLLCLVGNQRAMAFYQKMGWERDEVMTDNLEAAGQTFEVQACRLTKLLV